MGNNDETKEMNNKPKRRCRCRRRRRHRRPRQYLWDRVNGTSKYYDNDEESSSSDHHHRPPWRSCWVPPCVYYCSGCLEQNAVCEYVGARGCIEHDDDCGRRRSFFVAIASAKLAFLFSLLSCLAVSQNFNVLWMASFSQGTVYFVNQTTATPEEDHIWAMEPNQTYPVSEARVGLTAVAVREAYTEETITRSSDGTGQITGIRFIPELVVPFEEFCDILNDGLEYYMDPKQCGKCHQASSGLVLSCIASVVLELPSVLSDVLRMYPNYDVNCSKFFETVVVALSLLTSIYTAVEYGRACFANFYSGNVGYDHAGNVVRPDDALEDKAYLHYSWKFGNGLIFLYVSVACKVVDMVCNMAVQTPSITRNRKEQEEYERLYGKSNDNDNDNNNRNNMDSSNTNHNEESPVLTGTTSFETAAARQDTVDSSSVVVEQAGRQRDDDEEEGARYKNPPSGMTTKTEPGATIIVENNDVEQPRPPPPPPLRRTRREEQQQEDEDEPPRQQQDANNNPRGRRGTPPETGDGTTVDHTTERANNAQQQMKGEEEQDDDDDDERVRKVATIPTIKGRTSTETMLVDDGDDSSSIERSSSSPRERNDDDESQRAANNNNNNPAASRSTTTETAGRLEGTSSVDSSVLEWAPPHSGREQPQRGGFPKGTASTNETTAAAGEDTITTNESSSELLPGQRLRSELRSSF